MNGIFAVRLLRSAAAALRFHEVFAFFEFALLADVEGLNRTMVAHHAGPHFAGLTFAVLELDGVVSLFGHCISSYGAARLVLCSGQLNFFVRQPFEVREPSWQPKARHRTSGRSRDVPTGIRVWDRSRTSA